MSSITLLTAVLLVALGVNALPSNNTLKGKTCSVTSYSQASSVSSCDVVNVGSFTVPAKTTLIFNLKKGAKLNINGKIVWTYSGYWNNGLLMEIIGDSVTVTGASGHLLHGHGEKYWDGKGGAGKPTFVYLKGTNSKYNSLHFKNCPERCVAVDSSHNIVIDKFNIDNSEGAKLGHNTDGFDIAKSTYVTLKNSLVNGQDDCVAINSGSYITVNNLQCTGTHGFDVAVGQDASYENNLAHDITFSNSVFKNGLVGLHILTCSDGGKGKVYNIAYKNIKIEGAANYGIMIQQDFSNEKQGSTGKPTGNVPISNVTVSNVTGYMNGQYSTAVVIRCAACSNLNFKDVSITGAKHNNECSQNPSGFKC